MAKGFTPIIGLAVVVALAMVAVFGAMSLADPAQAAIDRSPAPTAMAVTSAGIVEGDGVLIDPAPTNGGPLVTYEDATVTYTLDNFAGRGPAGIDATDEGPTYVVEFELVGAFDTSNDRILIELPDGATIGTDTLTGVMVQGPRPTDGAVTADRPDYEQETVYNFLDEVGLDYGRDDNLVNDTRHLVITLANTLETARGTDNDDIKLRVIIPGMTNPAGHGGHDVNIYHYSDADGVTEDVEPKVSKRTATLMINSVMVEEVKNDDDEATGAFTLTFFAQQDYETSDEIEIEMPRFSLPRTIVEDDVEITWGGARQQYVQQVAQEC